MPIIVVISTRISTLLIYLDLNSTKDDRSIKINDSKYTFFIILKNTSVKVGIIGTALHIIS
jgi:hypothetical protein